MGIWYAAVEDDPLTSGPGSRVYAGENVGTIQGEDGRRRRMVFIGDEAWCAACSSMGVSRMEPRAYAFSTACLIW